MYHFHERNFRPMVQECLKITLVAKSMIDKGLLFNCCQILGCLYMHMEMLQQSRAVFDMMKDVAEDCHNWS